MATRTYALSVTIPAGTQQSNPQVTPWVTEDNQIDRIELLIPPGNNGLAGIRVMKGDTQLIPWGTGTWIVGNGTDHYWPIGAYLATSDMTIQAYNMGAYPHTFYLRMQVSDAFLINQSGVATEVDTTSLVDSTSSSDPLSPDQILGPETASALADGTITADDIASIDTTDLTAQPPPEPVA